MFIQTESTPNPATLKFLPGQTVLSAGTADFPTSEAAGASPLAGRLFAVDGVTGVFFGHDFVTVTKADEKEWDHLKPAILGGIMEHFQSGQPVIADGAAATAGTGPAMAQPAVRETAPAAAPRGRGSRFGTLGAGDRLQHPAARLPAALAHAHRATARRYSHQSPSSSDGKAQPR